MPMATTMVVTGEAELECVRPLRNVVGELARDAGLSDTQISIVKLCVSEAIANAVNHAYPDGEPGALEVTVQEDGDELVVVVADQGHAHRRRRSEPGGFGLAFVERLTDRCTFRATTGGTTVEMAFSRSPAPRYREPAEVFLIEHRRMTHEPLRVLRRPPTRRRLFSSPLRRPSTWALTSRFEPKVLTPGPSSARARSARCDSGTATE